MKSYYRTNNNVLTFGECWRLTRSPAAVVLWGCGILGINLGTVKGVAKIAYRASEIDEVGLPEEAREWVARTCLDLKSEGFDEPFWFHKQDASSPVEAAGCALRDASGDCMALIAFIKSTNVVPAKVERRVGFVTRRGDRSFLGTSNQPYRLKTNPEDRDIYLEGVSPARVLARHRAEITILRERNDLIPIQSRYEMIDVLDENENKEYMFLIHRRYLVELTDDETAALQTDVEVRRGKLTGLEEYESGPTASLADHEATAEEATHDLLVEVGKRHERQRLWFQTAFFLAMTGVVFVGVGVARWPPDIVLMLVPILLIHELGHLLTMRCFNYRDFRIFFIPLLGAAATGRNYNVAGWKKAVVCLMGPLPGIVLGGAVGAMSMYYGHDWGLRFAQLMVILNGISLLPILPLDGGQFMQATLFARHPKGEVVFKVLTAMGGFALFWVLDRWSVLFLCFLPLISIQYDYVTAMIARDLRLSGQIGAGETAETLSPASARTILNALTAKFPRGLDHKTLAGFTLGVFEKAKATPPGVLGLLALLVTYMVTIVASFVFLDLFAMG